jgi:hypothetical protein
MASFLPAAGQRRSFLWFPIFFTPTEMKKALRKMNPVSQT